VSVRFVGDEAREVSILPAGILRRVEPDEVFEVDEKVADSYACQPHLYEVDEVAAPAAVAKSTAPAVKKES
jgi:hypothetical protein